MNNRLKNKILDLNEPNFQSSYSPKDCLFLLKDIGCLVTETETEEKEHLLAKGIHYSEMIPKEYYPTREYLDLFHKSLRQSSQRIAQYVADLSRLLYEEKGKHIVLVSLARAGIPIGILVKRFLEQYYHLSVPHYAISIIRGKGIDENALAYILARHEDTMLQFIDGWTGKGAINQELQEAIDQFNAVYETKIDARLAVLADPSSVTTLYATREDFLIPSACLNSTVSGLSSRTFHKKGMIGENDFHGAKYYKEWESQDLSQYYIEEIVQHYATISPKKIDIEKIENSGIKEVRRIQKDFCIEDSNKIKPGIGETTRVLLRRVPWKILINECRLSELDHILILARDRKVPIEYYPNMTYSCIGIIKDLSN